MITKQITECISEDSDHGVKITDLIMSIYVTINNTFYLIQKTSKQLEVFY